MGSRPNTLLEKHLVFSRIPGANKEYVQDRIRTEHQTVATLLASPATHVYICGLKPISDVGNFSCPSSRRFTLKSV
jgi:benzoyl-CoA 2,3-epoxidase subunit A